MIPWHHAYSLGLITYSVRLLVLACVGLRCVEKILKLMTPFFQLPRVYPILEQQLAVARGVLQAHPREGHGQRLGVDRGLDDSGR